MTATATRRGPIDAPAYLAARREGLPPAAAAYVARPAVLSIDWLSHYQADGEFADVEIDGRTYRAEVKDPRAIEGDCIGCRELVDAYKRRDEGFAWITPDEFDNMQHAAVTVELLTGPDGDETGHAASLWGVCSFDSTPTQRRSAERYLAETVAELAREALAEAEKAAEKAAERRAADLAELRAAYLAALTACD